MTLATLYEDDEIVVVHQKGDSDYTLVTFADLTARPRPDWFWGQKPAGHLGLDAIGFVAKRPNWFPTANVARAAEAVRAAAQPMRLGYGYSMGAYATLKHGARLGLTHALSVAPQVSIDPADGLQDRRFIEYFRPDLHHGMRVTASDLPAWSAIVADPYDHEDREHLDHLPADPRLHIGPVPFVGHWAIWLFAHTDALAAALGCVRQQDLRGLRQALRRQRAVTNAWFFTMGAAALRHGHAAWAGQLWSRARHLGADPKALRDQRLLALTARARAQHAAGQPARAMATVAEALAALPDDADEGADLWRRVAHRLLVVAPAQSELLFRRVLQADPGNASSEFGLSHARLRQNDREEAIRHAARAVLAQPNDAELIAWAGHLLIGGHYPRQAEFMFRAALMLDGFMVHAHVGLSRALSAQGRFRVASSVIIQAQGRWPDDPDLAARRRDLSRITLFRRMRGVCVRQWLRLYPHLYVQPGRRPAGLGPEVAAILIDAARQRGPASGDDEAALRRCALAAWPRATESGPGQQAPA